MSEKSKELELVEKRLDVLERTLFGNANKGQAKLLELKTKSKPSNVYPHGR